MTDESVKVLATNVAKLVSAIAKVAHKDFLALLGLVAPAVALKNIDYAQVLAELKDLDEAERAEVEAAFLASLDLGDAALNAKVAASASILEESIALVAEGIVVVNRGIEVVNKLKALVGVGA